MIYFAKEAENSDTYINQNYSEEFNKTIVYSNPELQEIDIETQRSLTFKEELDDNVTAHRFLNYTEILPSYLK